MEKLDHIIQQWNDLLVQGVNSLGMEEDLLEKLTKADNAILGTFDRSFPIERALQYWKIFCIFVFALPQPKILKLRRN